MPRPLRIEFENAWYHVMNRGANRQVIFKNNSDKIIFYTLLDEISERFKIEIHAFCLMENHYHLLVRTPYANLSRAMRHLDGVYTQRHNRAAGRDGPLFRGRYKAILIDSDHYLLQVSRYIHLNPVVAKMCKKPLDFRWSSYHLYVNPKQLIAWVKTDFTLNLMNRENQISSYISFVAQGIDSETLQFYNKKHLPSIYGSKEFINSFLNNLDAAYIPSVQTDINHTKPLPSKNVVLSTIIKYYHISYEELCRTKRGNRNFPKMVAIYLLGQLAHLKQNEIASVFKSLKAGSIPTQVNRLKKQMKADEAIKKQVDEIVDKISGCT